MAGCCLWHFVRSFYYNNKLYSPIIAVYLKRSFWVTDSRLCRFNGNNLLTSTREFSVLSPFAGLLTCLLLQFVRSFSYNNNTVFSLQRLFWVIVSWLCRFNGNNLLTSTQECSVFSFSELIIRIINVSYIVVLTVALTLNSSNKLSPSTGNFLRCWVRERCFSQLLTSYQLCLTALKN